jgi:hypothetical protein
VAAPVDLLCQVGLAGKEGVAHLHRRQVTSSKAHSGQGVRHTYMQDGSSSLLSAPNTDAMLVPSLEVPGTLHQTQCNGS